MIRFDLCGPKPLDNEATTFMSKVDFIKCFAKSAHVLALPAEKRKVLGHLFERHLY